MVLMYKIIYLGAYAHARYTVVFLCVCVCVCVASILGRTEDGPGIDCLRMCHINPQKLGTLDNIVHVYAQ